MTKPVAEGSVTPALARELVMTRLAALGFAMPAPPRPVGAYSAVVARQGLATISGQFPIENGKVRFAGRVGADLTEADGMRAAEIAALNVIAHIDAATDGFRRFKGLLRLDGFVASETGYLDQPKVLDGASNLLVAILGEEFGAHTRTAFSVSQLPLNAAIELAVMFAVTDSL